MDGFRNFLYYTRTNRLFLTGLVIVGGALIVTAFPGLFAPIGPEDTSAAALLEPSRKHLFGTDISGMDIYSRVIWAPRIDLTIALSSTIVAFVFGVGLGVWTGYYAEQGSWKGWLSDGVLRIMDVLQAFPIFILALALLAVLGRSIVNVIYVLIVLDVPIFLRLTRSAAVAIREKSYIEAARCVGNSETRVIFRHVLPNSLSPALINFSVLTGAGVLLTAGLSFVGAGVPPPTPELGFMVSAGAPNLFTGQWWPAVFPGLAIGVLVLGMSLVSDGLRDYLDPARRT